MPSDPAPDSREEGVASGYECVVALGLTDVFAAFHAAPDTVAVLRTGAGVEYCLRVVSRAF